MRTRVRRHSFAIAASLAVFVSATAGHAEPQYLDQGAAWTAETREAFYRLDQGSQLIPLAWLQALHRKDGTAFDDDAFARYGFLPGPTHGLPLGFTVAASPRGPMVGVSCAACHTRQIETAGKTYRIDGGPAFSDLGTMVADLDDAVLAVLKDDASFAPFAKDVLAEKAGDTDAIKTLHADVSAWSTRFHTYIGGTINPKRPWGTGRLDAMQLIFNQVAGVDIGPAPDHIISGNIKVGTAPVRYPFVWNAAIQDHVQWGGFSKNGNDIFALTRNLGQVYGVFGMFVPQPLPSASKSPINRDYLSVNSANFPGLFAAENAIKLIGPPKWPWAVDAALAQKGAAIFARSAVDGGCAECHGQRPGTPRPPVVDTWYTPRVDVGTDLSVWDNVLLRPVDTGTLEGASVPEYFPPLLKTDSVLSLLEVAVLGSILEYQATHDTPAEREQVAKAVVAARAEMARRAAEHPVDPKNALDDKFKVHVFEARVLRGVWAAAPYLHNGSVPTLADLLKPATERPKTFKVGQMYDPVDIGLAVNQAKGSFTLHTTGCDEIRSGDSNCGHEYGSRLPPDEKRALLEYLKTL